MVLDKLEDQKHSRMSEVDRSIRVQKYLANQGVCSRRAAEKAIEAGIVSINGETAKLGDRVLPGKDRVVYEGRAIRFKKPERVTIALNKPKGFVCSNDDPHNERTVFDLVPAEYAKNRLFCAGRLDVDSEGLLILTNDGDLANQLMHPSSLVVKRYQVWLKQPYPKNKLQRLVRGITFEGERLKVEEATFIGSKTKETSTEIDVSMHHGKKREIRRLFTALGYDVKRLKRYQIGRYSIKGIPKGAGISLQKSDIRKLFQQEEKL